MKHLNKKVNLKLETAQIQINCILGKINPNSNLLIV